MPLLYCGIDEAGYGPLLGPLCVGMSVFLVEQWAEGDPAPDLWRSLDRAVDRRGSGSSKSTHDWPRLLIDDSKKVKLANSSTTKHPLHHLERGILAMLLCREGAEPFDPEQWHDADFFHTTGVTLPHNDWYGGSAEVRARPCPAGARAGEVNVAASVLRSTLAAAGIRLLDLRCEAVGETVFNQIVDAAGTKAAVTESAIFKHLWAIWDRCGQSSGGDGSGAAASEFTGVRIVCDQQGGRTQYAPMLERAFPEATIRVLDEGEQRCRYEIAATAPTPRRMVIQFMPEAESAHLPVALASMLAKLAREMLMARFNRYWCERLPELKPTAGYRQDAWRWLTDIGPVLTRVEREALIRRA